MLVVLTAASALVLGVMLSLWTNNWLFLLLALAAHAIASVLVIMVVFRRIEEGDKPDPVEAAHIEAGDRDEPEDTGGLTKSGRRADREVIH